MTERLFITISLDQIDQFIYDIHNDTDDIIRDFNKNKFIMENFFSGVIVHHKDKQEEILMLIYMILCMKTKLNYLDKSISELVFNYLKNTSSDFNLHGGKLDKADYLLLKKEIPLAFNSIYSQYAEYKIRYIEELLSKQSVTYLDQLLLPVSSNVREIISVKDVSYFTSYYNFYSNIMKYIRDFLSIIEDEFRKNEMTELYRYYLYRRVLEIDRNDKNNINKNNILRNTIDTYKNGVDVLNMLYGDVIEERLVNNVLDCLRKKVTSNSEIILIVKDKLSKIKSLGDEKMISYFSKTFDKLANRVTRLLEYKQSGGLIIKQTEGGEKEIVKLFRNRINKILYCGLRKADSIHDFIIGQRTTPEFKKIDFLDSINFLVNKEFILNKKDTQKVFMNYSEILQDTANTEIFDEMFIFDEDSDNNGKNINLAELERSIQGRTNFETNIIDYFNRFIYSIYKSDNTDGENIKKELLSVYRPGNTILEEILLNMPLTHKNTAEYVNKEFLFEMEHTGDLDYKFFTSTIGNLLFVMYEDDILTAGENVKRKNIITKVKEFLGIDSVLLSVDFQSSSSTFFKIFTEDENDGGKNVFIRPSRVLAEIWDPARNKTIKNINVVSMTQNISTDLLNTEKNFTMCEENYKVTIKDDTNQHLMVNAGINIEKLDSTKIKELDIENDDRSKRFHPEVKKISDLILKTDNSIQRCKLLYLKNSGDWGEVTSANENKTFLLTEDKLCSYYSILTNTSTIYTIKRGNRYITILHKGNIDMKWEEMIKQIQDSLINNSYYLFSNEIEIKFNVTEKSGADDNYTLMFKLSSENSITMTKTGKFLELNDLKTLKIVQIKYVNTETNDVLIVTNNIPIKDVSVNKDIPLTIIDILSIYSKNILKTKKEEFLKYHEKKSTNFEQEIFSDFFDKYYQKIINVKANSGESIETLLNNYVKNMIVEHIKEHIISIYLLSLNNADRNNPFHTALDTYFKSIYQKLIYKYKELNWSNEINAILTDDYNDNLEKKIREIEHAKTAAKDSENEANHNYELVLAEPDSKNKKSKLKEANEIKKEATSVLNKLERKNILLIPFGSKKYKEYHIKTETNIYHMEYYNYALTKEGSSEILDFDILFIASISTNGLWDIFEMNPFIYAYYAEYLKKNYKSIPESSDKSEIKKLKQFYSSIDVEKITAEKEFEDLILFIQEEKKRYEFDQKKSLVKPSDKPIYIDALKKLKIYELSLFYYLYNIGIKDKKNSKFLFKSLEDRSNTTIEDANVIVYKKGVSNIQGSVAKFTLNFEIRTPFVGEYLNMLDKIILPEQNLELTQLISNIDSNVSKYFESIAKSKLIINDTEIKILITKYIEHFSKKYTKDLDYYSSIMSILKTVKNILEQNEIYLNVIGSIKSTVSWFIFMTSSYIEEYDKVSEIIKQVDQYQLCLLTRSLLTQIKENIAGKDELKYIYYLLEEAIKKEITKVELDDALIENRERLNKIVEINKLLYNEPKPGAALAAAGENSNSVNSESKTPLALATLHSNSVNSVSKPGLALAAAENSNSVNSESKKPLALAIVHSNSANSVSKPAAVNSKSIAKSVEEDVKEDEQKLCTGKKNIPFKSKFYKHELLDLIKDKTGLDNNTIENKLKKYFNKEKITVDDLCKVLGLSPTKPMRLEEGKIEKHEIGLKAEKQFLPICVTTTALHDTLTLPQAIELLKKLNIPEYTEKYLRVLKKHKVCELLDKHGVAKLMTYAKAKSVLADIYPKKSSSESPLNASDVEVPKKVSSESPLNDSEAEVPKKVSSESPLNDSEVEVPKNKVDCLREITNTKECFISKKIIKGTLTIKDAQQILVCEKGIKFDSIKDMNKKALCMKLKELGVISDIRK